LGIKLVKNDISSGVSYKGAMVMKDAQVKLKLVDMVYQQLKFGQLAECLVFTILMAVLWNVSNKTVLLTWYVLSMILCGIRYLFTLQYKKSQAPLKSLKKYIDTLALCALLAGISWGVIGSVLIPMAFSTKQAFVIFLLVGVTATGNLFYSPVKRIYPFFLFAAYAPHIFWLFSRGGDYTWLAACAVIYMGLMLILSAHTHKIITSAVILQFENTGLVTSLSTAKKQLEYLNDKLIVEAAHDPLTNLLNRRSMAINFNELIEISKRENGILAILFCDLDNFKKINDNYGHAIGDQLLIEVARRLQKTLHASDVIARLGGDEFIVILNKINVLEEVKTTVDALLKAMNETVNVENHQFQIGMSIGISLFPFDAEDDKMLLKYADYALYKAKSAGRNRYELYSTLVNH
jgi:diguanylate cyclase (GGDEF)-like protein